MIATKIDALLLMQHLVKTIFSSRCGGTTKINAIITLAFRVIN